MFAWCTCGACQGQRKHLTHRLHSPPPITPAPPSLQSLAGRAFNVALSETFLRRVICLQAMRLLCDVLETPADWLCALRLAVPVAEEP